jgi:hypothetical protein
MANHVRGFTSIQLGGMSFDVSLSLGALAELEAEFGVETFEDALNFGERVSATKLRKFMHGLLRGNSIAVTPEIDRAVNQMTLAEFTDMTSDLLVKAGFASQAPAPDHAEGDKNAPLADKSAGELG